MKHCKDPSNKKEWNYKHANVGIFSQSYAVILAITDSSLVSLLFGSTSFFNTIF